MSLRGFPCVPEVKKSQESKIVSVHEDKSCGDYDLPPGRWRSRSDQKSPSRLWCWDGYLFQIQQIEKMVGFDGKIEGCPGNAIAPILSWMIPTLKKNTIWNSELSELSVTIIKFQLKCGISWNFWVFGPAPSCFTASMECWGARRHSTSGASSIHTATPAVLMWTAGYQGFDPLLDDLETGRRWHLCPS